MLSNGNVGIGITAPTAHLHVVNTTDEVGLHAVDERLHVHDLHATILYLLGLNNMDLIYKYKGRPERPTLNEGEAYKKITGA